MDLSNVDRDLITIGTRLKNDINDWEAWAAKADILYSLGLYENAIQCCDMSLKLNQNNAFAWHTKGTSLDKLGRHEEAEACYNRARELEQCFNEHKLQ